MKLSNRRQHGKTESLQVNVGPANRPDTVCVFTRPVSEHRDRDTHGVAGIGCRGVHHPHRIQQT